jgi:hypothetical protein
MTFIYFKKVLFCDYRKLSYDRRAVPQHGSGGIIILRVLKGDQGLGAP